MKSKTTQAPKSKKQIKPRPSEKKNPVVKGAALSGQEKKEKGRPGVYDEESCCRIAKQILELSGTETDLSIALGVSNKTIYNWKKEHPEFKQIVDESKALVDSEMIRTLAKLGLGQIVITEDKAIKVKTKKGEAVEVVQVTRTIPPDLGALKLWLLNRRPDDFKDKQVIEHEGELTQTQVHLYQPDISAAPEMFKAFLQSGKARLPQSEPTKQESTV